VARSKENWCFVGSMVAFGLLFARPSSVISAAFVDPVVDGFGFVLVLVGLLIRLASRDWKLRQEDERLVTDGPYGYVRNPMYVGSFLAGLGLCIVFGSLPFIVFYTAAFFVTHMLVARREERYLRSVYADDYENYVRQVPAWFPSIAGFRKLLKCSLSWIQSAPRALLKERHAIAGNLIGACLLEVAADSIARRHSVSHLEVAVWLIVASSILAIWAVSGRVLHRLADVRT